MDGLYRAERRRRQRASAAGATERDQQKREPVLPDKRLVCPEIAL
jgi:hypothetical protein